jgi:hypothetical protein
MVHRGCLLTYFRVSYVASRYIPPPLIRARPRATNSDFLTGARDLPAGTAEMFVGRDRRV